MNILQTSPEAWIAWEQAGDFPAMAEAGRLDPFAFINYILGYDRLQEKIHRPWCAWGADMAQLRRLRLAPRETYKSTVLTIGLALWFLIQDAQPVVRGVKGNNLRILIANAVESRAMDFLREIDGHILRNELFIACYGNLYNKSQWTGSQKTISTRTINRKEPSLQAIGKGGQLTSSHYDIALVDDIANERDRESANERDRTLRWVKDLLSLVHPDGLVQFVGTPWHYEDVYYWLAEVLNQELLVAGEIPYTVVSEECYLADGVTPRYPTILDTGKLNRLKIEKGSFDFYAQYRLKPFPPEAQTFRESELTYFDMEDLPDDRLLEYVGYCDPALGKSETACFSANLTLARHQVLGDLYLVGADLRRCSTEILEEEVLSAFHYWHYAKYGIECNGFQDEVRKNFEKRLKVAGMPFVITAIINTGDKIQRIQAAEPIIKAIHYRRDWRQAYPEFMRQLMQFPHGDFVDGPDALEGVIRMTRKGRVNGRRLASSNQQAAQQGAHQGLGSQVLREHF